MSDLEQQQRAICAKFGSPVVEADPGLKCGLAIKTVGAMPIYGVRQTQEGGTTGWYFWCGEYSEDPEFFDPLCAAHLPDFLPTVLPYLALAPGHSFIIDDRGYEDVWLRPEFPDPGG